MRQRRHWKALKNKYIKVFQNSQKAWLFNKYFNKHNNKNMGKAFENAELKEIYQRQVKVVSQALIDDVYRLSSNDELLKSAWELRNLMSEEDL